MKLGDLGLVLVIGASLLIISTKSAFIGAGPITAAKPRGITPAPKKASGKATTRAKSTGGGVGGPSTQAKKDKADEEQARRNTVARVKKKRADDIARAKRIGPITPTRLNLTLPKPPTTLKEIDDSCRESGGYMSGGACKNIQTGQTMSKHETLKGYYVYHLKNQADKIIAPYIRAALQRLAVANGYLSKQDMENKDRSAQYKIGLVIRRYEVLELKMINNKLAEIGVSPSISLGEEKNQQTSDIVRRSNADPKSGSGAEYAV